jgi:hypothetical protein
MNGLPLTIAGPIVGGREAVSRFRRNRQPASELGLFCRSNYRNVARSTFRRLSVVSASSRPPGDPRRDRDVGEPRAISRRDLALPSSGAAVLARQSWLHPDDRTTLVKRRRRSGWSMTKACPLYEKFREPRDEGEVSPVSEIHRAAVRFVAPTCSLTRRTLPAPEPSQYASRRSRGKLAGMCNPWGTTDGRRACCKFHHAASSCTRVGRACVDTARASANAIRIGPNVPYDPRQCLGRAVHRHRCSAAPVFSSGPHLGREERARTAGSGGVTQTRGEPDGLGSAS